MIRYLFLSLVLLSGCLPFGKSSGLQFSEGLSPSLVTITATTAVNYQNLKKHVLNRHCISCHNSVRAEDEIDLSSYEAITNPLSVPIFKPGLPKRSRLWRSVSKGSMPPGKRPKLNELEIGFIWKWIESCAPEKVSDYLDCQITKIQQED